jgi:hypothetical protein
VITEGSGLETPRLPGLETDLLPQVAV